MLGSIESSATSGMFTVDAGKMLGLTIAWYLLTVPQEERKTPVIYLSSWPVMHSSSTAHVHLQEQASLAMSSLYPCCTLVVPSLYPRGVPNHPIRGSLTSVQRVYMLEYFCGNPSTPPLAPLTAPMLSTTVQATVDAYKLT